MEVINLSKWDYPVVEAIERGLNPALLKTADKKPNWTATVDGKEYAVYEDKIFMPLVVCWTDGTYSRGYNTNRHIQTSPWRPTLTEYFGKDGFIEDFKPFPVGEWTYPEQKTEEGLGAWYGSDCYRDR